MPREKDKSKLTWQFTEMTEQGFNLAKKLGDAWNEQYKKALGFKPVHPYEPMVDSYDYGVNVSFEKKQLYALPSEGDGEVAKITVAKMYGCDISMEMLEVIAEIFGSKKINLGTEEGLSSGCGTCGYGSFYRIDIFVLDPKPVI